MLTIQLDNDHEVSSTSVLGWCSEDEGSFTLLVGNVGKDMFPNSSIILPSTFFTAASKVDSLGVVAVFSGRCAANFRKFSINLQTRILDTAPSSGESMLLMLIGSRSRRIVSVKSHVPMMLHRRKIKALRY